MNDLVPLWVVVAIVAIGLGGWSYFGLYRRSLKMADELLVQCRARIPQLSSVSALNYVREAFEFNGYHQKLEQHTNFVMLCSILLTAIGIGFMTLDAGVPSDVDGVLRSMLSRFFAVALGPFLGIVNMLLVAKSRERMINCKREAIDLALDRPDSAIEMSPAYQAMSQQVIAFGSRLLQVNQSLENTTVALASCAANVAASSDHMDRSVQSLTAELKAGFEAAASDVQKSAAETLTAVASQHRDGLNSLASFSQRVGERMQKIAEHSAAVQTAEREAAAEEMRRFHEEHRRLLGGVQATVGKSTEQFAAAVAAEREARNAAVDNLEIAIRQASSRAAEESTRLTANALQTVEQSVIRAGEGVASKASEMLGNLDRIHEQTTALPQKLISELTTTLTANLAEVTRPLTITLERNAEKILEASDIEAREILDQVKKQAHALASAIEDANRAAREQTALLRELPERSQQVFGVWNATVQQLREIIQSMTTELPEVTRAAQAVVSELARVQDLAQRIEPQSNGHPTAGRNGADEQTARPRRWRRILWPFARRN